MLKEIQNNIEKWYNGETNFGQGNKYYSIAASGNTITIKYNPIVREIEEFKDYINKMDDDLFIDVCENIGNKNLLKISEALTNEDDSSIEAINEFKQSLKKMLESKLNYYQECWNNLIK